MNYELAHAELAADAREAEAPAPGTVMIGGKPHLIDTKGRYVPRDLVKPFDLLMDETVRKIVGYAQELSAQITRFKHHTLDDVSGLKALLAQEHNVSIGGAKGNVTLTSFDGLMKVSLKIADLTFYGPELQAAKSKVDECLRGWSEGAKPELIAIVENAFRVDQAGQINRSNLLYLKRLHSDNPLWREAMALIDEAERPMGTKEYVQVHVRPHIGAAWEHVSIDVASA